MEVNDVLQIFSISKRHSLHACCDTLLGIYTSLCQHKLSSLLFRNKYMLKKIYETEK